MFMCHMRQLIAHLVEIASPRTASHISQLEFSNFGKDRLCLFCEMRLYFMLKRCREVTKMESIRMFAKIARTHSMSKVLNAREILLNKNLASPKQIPNH